MFDFVHHRKWFYALTGGLMIASVLALVITPHLPRGLEFSSGSALDIEFKDPRPGTGPAELRASLEAAGVKGAVVQQTGDKAFFIRTSRVEDKLDDILAQQFPTAKAQSLQSGSDLASVVSFKDPVPADKLKAQFDPGTQGLIVNKTGDSQFFISAQGVGDDKLQQVLAAYQKRYGPMEATNFKDSGDMAMTLDFGPAVAEADLKGELEKVVPDLQVTTIGTNTFLVVGTNLPADKKGDLVPALEKRFGRSKVTTYNEPGDLSLTLTFDKPVAINDVRNELINKSFFIRSLPNGDKSIILLAKTLAADKRDEVVKVLKDKFGAVQPAPFDFNAGVAENLDFGATVTVDALQKEVARVRPNAAVSALGGNAFFIGGKGVTEQQQNALVAALETGLGLAQRSPFDYAKATAFQVKFTDPVQLNDVVGSLAIFPINDAVQGRASAQAISPNNFFLFSASILPDARSSVLADIKGKVGAFDQSGFDKPGDMRVALDFGPAVNTTELRGEATRLQPGANIDALDQQTFFLGGLDVPADKRDALLSGIESRFGLARKTSFDGSSDWALALAFQDNVTIGSLRAEVNAQSVKGVVVGSLGGRTFFVGGKGITAERQTTVLDALQKRFNNFDRTPFDFTKSVAMNLDFGEAVTAGTFRAQVLTLGFVQDVRVEPVGDTAFFLGASGFSADKQTALISGLETRFGLAHHSDFDAPNNLAVTLHLTDPDQVAKAVREKLIVQKLGANKFFLGGASINSDRQQQTVSSLESGLGAVQRQPYDFTTSVATILTFPTPVAEDGIRSTLQPFGYTNMVIEPRGESTYFIRSDRPSVDQKNRLVKTLEEAFGPSDPTKLEFSFVDAEIARRSIVNTFIAVAVSCIGIMLYVWWAFRKAPKPFRFGVAVVTGLIHDVVIVLGAFGIMAKFREVSFDSLMIIGLLAVIGYSVNNTIVVLDRLRENLAKSPGRGLDSSVNLSLNETLARNLNTTVTVVLAILAVLLFGGSTIFNFMLVLLVGMIAGLYSSLFIAAPLLVSWEKGELPRLRVPFLKRRTSAPAAKPQSS